MTATPKVDIQGLAKVFVEPLSGARTEALRHVSLSIAED
jgi:hypothetical protein